jgi:hypothetical protein
LETRIRRAIDTEFSDAFIEFAVVFMTMINNVL